jgi:hypothetical protein
LIKKRNISKKHNWVPEKIKNWLLWRKNHYKR